MGAVRRHAGTLLLFLVAIICAVVPFPPQFIEGAYSLHVYPAIQQVVTRTSNLVPIALLDVAIALLLVILFSLVIARTRRVGFRRGGGQAVLTLLRCGAVLYLLFLALWGLNYRRVPLEQKLDYDRGRITRDSVVALANRAVAALNAGHAGAHASTLSLDGLGYAFGDAERQMGSRGFTTLGIPKRSLLTMYFRRAAIDGMTDPFFLEIIVNPDVLAVERPMVITHEWGHLAGYANESDASFIAWLSCMRGDPLAQYSGWLSAYAHAVRALPRQERSAVAPLGPGPREDLRTMIARYERSSAVVRRAAETVYDEYLRANRVAEGIGSYDAVVRLMVGTRFDTDGRPVMR
jgi:hypothetical protein